MSTSLLPMDAVDRLSTTVLAGQAVFFVGAGFSLDSEGNEFAPRLVVRLAALLRTLHEKTVDPKNTALVETVTHDFATVFWVKPDQPANDDAGWQALIESWTKAEAMSTFGSRYYEFNDWMVSSFQALLRQLQPSDLAQVAIYDAWFKTRAVAPKLKSASAVDGWRLDLHPVTEEHIDLARQDGLSHRLAGGKALLLDTMGFREVSGRQGLMAGDAEHRDVIDAVQSYGQRLRARHIVLARMAREGWLPLLVTTNFDRLLEGGFRAAGFDPESALPAGKSNPAPLPVPMWRTIGSPTDFFDDSGQTRRALVVKIHGCSRRYEQRAAAGLTDKPFHEYLRSMVFTYREIQNWREDSWSRDFLRTLLRTRTMVFSGYSAKDDVIHDTLREVYEEMARERRRAPHKAPIPAAKPSTLPVPAYFTTVSGKEFHGLEVLRAAYGAVNGVPELRTECEAAKNYLPAKFVGNVGSVDDLMLWLWHRCFRKAQREALQHESRRLALMLMGIPVDSTTVEQLLGRWEKMVEAENKVIEALTDARAPASRRTFDEVTLWTDAFHPALLREMACMESETRSVDASHWESRLRKMRHFYYPGSAQTAWTAWGAILELALRQMAKSAANSRIAPTHCHQPTRHPTDRPTVTIQTAPGKLPVALTVAFTGMQRGGPVPAPVGVVQCQRVWVLPAGTAPWPPNTSANPAHPAASPRPSLVRGRVVVPVPDAQVIWKWALGHDDPVEAKALLGLP